MNSRVEQPKSASPAGDVVKYVVAAALLAGGLFVFYWFNWPTVVRVLAVLAGLVGGAFVFLSTTKGAQTREYLYESRFELRKVVWPTRQETMRTTWVVFGVVVLISLMLAGFDQLISMGVKALLGG